MARDELREGLPRYEAPQVLRLQVPQPARAACASGADFGIQVCLDGAGASDTCSVGAGVGQPSVCVPGSAA